MIAALPVYAVYALAGAFAVAGVVLLRTSWDRRSGPHWKFVAPGWVLIAASFATLMQVMSGEVASAYGLLILAVSAYAIIAMTAEQRGKNSRGATGLALEPEQRRTNWPRAAGKSLLAIVLAGIAAIGIGVAFAVAMPMATHDRVIIGGILVPLLWGGGMAWTLADAKLMRATVILVCVSAVSYAIAFLPKMLAR